MLDFLVGLLQFSYYITLFVFMPITLLLRVLIVMKNSLTHKVRLFIIFDVTSFSYYYFLNEEQQYFKLYNRLLAVMTFFTFLAFAFGVHMYF